MRRSKVDIPKPLDFGQWYSQSNHVRVRARQHAITVPLSQIRKVMKMPDLDLKQTKLDLQFLFKRSNRTFFIYPRISDAETKKSLKERRKLGLLRACMTVHTRMSVWVSSRILRAMFPVPWEEGHAFQCYPDVAGACIRVPLKNPRPLRESYLKDKLSTFNQPKKKTTRIPIPV